MSPTEDPRYQLIALPDAGRTGPWRHLGTHPDLESALRARVEDVITQLAANDGWLITCEHFVIGPGPEGPATVFGHVTEIGADPAVDHVPDPHNEAGARRWLLSAHRLG
jgi:hypothetical protein